MLKGAIDAKGDLNQGNHDIESLKGQFDELFPEEKDIREILDKYIVNITAIDHPIGRFCKTNGVSPSKFYEALRYPTSRGGSRLLHSSFKHGEDKVVTFYEDLADDAESLRKLFVKLGDSLSNA